MSVRFIMGRVLSWQPILWIEFSCNQWEVVSWSQGASIFVLWGEEVFFKLCLVWRVDCPLFTFHLDNGQLTFHERVFFGGRVSMKFPRGSPSSQCVSQYVSNSTTLLSPMLCPKVLPFLTYIARTMGRHSILQQQTFILGEPPKFQFFLLSFANQSDSLQPKKPRTWEHPSSILIRKVVCLFCLSCWDLPNHGAS
jgi:hypothetical protein